MSDAPVPRARPRARPPAVLARLPRCDDRAVLERRPRRRRPTTITKEYVEVTVAEALEDLQTPGAGDFFGRIDRGAAHRRTGGRHPRHVLHRPPAHRGRPARAGGGRLAGPDRGAVLPGHRCRPAGSRATAAGSRWSRASSPRTSTSTSTTRMRPRPRAACPTRCSPRSARPAPVRCARSSPRSRPSRTW